VEQWSGGFADRGPSGPVRQGPVGVVIQKTCGARVWQACGVEAWWSGSSVDLWGGGLVGQQRPGGPTGGVPTGSRPAVLSVNHVMDPPTHYSSGC
jgi:hypothetical protein